MKKLKTALCLSSALLLSSTAVQAAWQYNWLLGLSAGWADHDAHLDLAIAQPSGTGTSLITDIGDDGFIGGVFGGFQARCRALLIGLELNVDWSDLDDTHNFAFVDVLGDTWSASARYDRGTTIGLTARVGYEIWPWLMPYVRFGVETSEDELSIAASAPGVPLSAIVSDERQQFRFVGGVGAEFPVPSLAGLSFRLEYNYHSRGKGAHTDGFASDNITFFTADARGHTHSGKASVVWNFF